MLLTDENSKAAGAPTGGPAQSATPPAALAVNTRDDALRLRSRTDSGLRRRIAEITADAARDWIRAPESISRSLRNARELGAPERRFVSDAVHELTRHRRKLAYLAGSLDPLALFDAWLADGDDPAPAEERIAALADPIERLALSVSWPDWLMARTVAALGEAEARALACAMNRRAPLVVRANRLKTTREALAARLALIGVESSPSCYTSDGLILHTRHNVHAMDPFREGWMELQDEGSQLVAELCAPSPRSAVIDACAGAGGKTLAIGAALQNRGRLLAFDISRPKLDELRKRANRAGLTNVHARLVDSGQNAPTPEAAPAARVLVDAPCSGIGVLRRNPETKWRLREADLNELPQKQLHLLERYAPLVEVGGRLVYATCSVMPDENERVVEAFAAAHPEFERVPAKEILGAKRALAIGDGETLKLLPHVHDTDGFFGAVLRRRRSG